MGYYLIGLYGSSRAGKDTVAGFLGEDFQIQQRAMAERIRLILLQLDPLIATDDGKVMSFSDLYMLCNYDWDEVKAQSRESVDYMIRLGQACRDIIGEDVWLNAVMPADNYLSPVVISDVRQPNEYHAIKEAGGVIWKIVRPGLEQRGMDGLLEGYEFDAIINNDGTLDDLRQTVAKEVGKLETIQ